MNPAPFAGELRDQAILRMRENTDKIIACLSHFDDDSVWHRANENSLSTANQLLHLSGNITQYILSGLGGRPDARVRDLEFSARSGMTKDELRNRFLDVITDAIAVIEQCSDAEWLRYRHVQGFHLSGVGIVIHVVEHYSYHTGQIVARTKEIFNRPMGFYEGIDLNTKNAAD